MFLEATLSLSFDQRTECVTVPAPTAVGRLLHTLTFGQLGLEWERETFEATDMLRQLRAALADAGLTNVVSVALDDEIVYLDERRKDRDLDPVMAELVKHSRQVAEFPVRLELVTELEDEVGTYFIQLTADRVHPVDQSPLRLRVYALLRELDVTRLPADGYRDSLGAVSRRVERYMLQRMQTPEGYRQLVAPLEIRLGELCKKLEASLRVRLKTHGTRASVLPCVLRPREALEFEKTGTRDETTAAPIFRAYPGVREATYYLRLWLSVLRSLRAKISETLVVDEAGRPVLHVAKEPLALAETDALVPGESIAAPTGVFDLMYFAGNDYAEELAREHRLSSSDPAEGERAWDVVRTRQMGVEHRYIGFDFGAYMDGGMSTGSVVIESDRVDLSITIPNVR